MCAQDNKNKEDALVAILKLLVDECKAVYANKDLGASVNVMSISIFKHLKLANFKETDMVVEMVDMTKKSPLRIVENILCIRSCDNESINTIDSVNNTKELEVKHEDMVRGPNLDRIISRWHVCKPVQVFYDNKCGKDCEM
nr:hypothetical protein [Tanacetum cinerariifolium]